MNITVITFGNSEKPYLYKTKLNLIEGAKYRITNEHWNNYDGAIVTCKKFYKNINTIEYNKLMIDPSILKEIIMVECIGAPKPNPPYRIQNIYENFEKGTTTVLWDDGDKTIIRCNPEDEWDREKAIAIAYMKKHFDNRGCYNDEIKKWCAELDKRSTEQYEEDLKQMHKYIRNKYHHEAF